MFLCVGLTFANKTYEDLEPGECLTTIVNVTIDADTNQQLDRTDKVTIEPMADDSKGQIYLVNVLYVEGDMPVQQNVLFYYKDSSGLTYWEKSTFYWDENGNRYLHSFTDFLN